MKTYTVILNNIQLSICKKEKDIHITPWWLINILDPNFWNRYDAITKIVARKGNILYTK